MVLHDEASARRTQCNAPGTYWFHEWFLVVKQSFLRPCVSQAEPSLWNASTCPRDRIIRAPHSTWMACESGGLPASGGPCSNLIMLGAFTTTYIITLWLWHLSLSQARRADELEASSTSLPPRSLCRRPKFLGWKMTWFQSPVLIAARSVLILSF